MKFPSLVNESHLGPIEIIFSTPVTAGKHLTCWKHWNHWNYWNNPFHYDWKNQRSFAAEAHHSNVILIHSNLGLIFDVNISIQCLLFCWFSPSLPSSFIIITIIVISYYSHPYLQCLHLSSLFFFPSISSAAKSCGKQCWIIIAIFFSIAAVLSQNKKL